MQLSLVRLNGRLQVLLVGLIMTNDSKISVDMKSRSALRLNILVSLFLIASGCSSRPKMMIGKTAPPTFTMSGTNQANLFQVSDGENVIWKIYPRNKRFQLWEFATIIYGDVPSNCEQVIPTDRAAPPLVEGKTYQATVVISDDDALRVSFSIEDGRIVEHR